MKLRDWHAREVERNPAYAAASAEVEFVQSIADRLVEARVAAGLTQGDLADRAGTTQARISEMEAGDGNPTADTIARVFLALGLSASVVTKPLGTEKATFEAPSTSTHTEPLSELVSAPCGSATVLVQLDPSALEVAAYAELQMDGRTTASVRMTDEHRDPGVRIAQIYVENANFRHREDHLTVPHTARPDVGPVVVDLEAGLSPNQNNAIVRVRVATTPENTGLYAFELSMVALLHADEQNPNMPLEKYVSVAGTTLLYPFVREAVANLTGRGRFGPVWLSPFNVRHAWDSSAVPVKPEQVRLPAPSPKPKPRGRGALKVGKKS